MTKYLIIQKNANGSMTVKDSVTENKVTYYFMSLEDAIREHRKTFNLKNLKFTRIYI